MKRYFKAVLVLLLLVCGTLVSSSAMAQRSGHAGGYVHGGGYGHGWGWGGGPRWGISIGLPLYWPGYYGGYYPYPAYGYPGPAYAYPGPAVAPSAGYIEQGAPQAAPQSQGDWYYCADSKSYYPYVRECSGGWQRVPSIPPH
jgi:hypothetical protein